MTGRVVAPGRGTVDVPGRFVVVDVDAPGRDVVPGRTVVEEAPGRVTVVDGLVAGCLPVVDAELPGRTLEVPGRVAVVVEAALPGRIDWAVAEELKPKAKRAAASMEV